VQRKLVTRDHKLVYWFGGVLASLSILLERKTERIELALYVLSNAANSLWHMLVKRHLIPEIPYAEVQIHQGLFTLFLVLATIHNHMSSLSRYSFSASAWGVLCSFMSMNLGQCLQSSRG
jgi:hypothetical protein